MTSQHMDVFLGFLKATIQIGGFYILNNGSQLCSDPDAVGWFPHVSTIFTIPPLHSFWLEPRLQRPNRYSICWCFSSQKHKYTDVIYDGLDVKGSAYIFDV